MSRCNFFIKLSPEESKSLDGFLKDALSKRNMRARRRGQAVYWSNYGWTVAKIAQQLKTSERSVWKWLDAYRKKGVEGLRGKRVFKRIKY
ncbi:MAG: helix-turn-helix domain-containing protein [Planctomycetes bacterium]|nr:helix-turn-helix domain-containing protein [Planctomycetota bacterium]